MELVSKPFEGRSTSREWRTSYYCFRYAKGKLIKSFLNVNLFIYEILVIFE